MQNLIAQLLSFFSGERSGRSTTSDNVVDDGQDRGRPRNSFSTDEDTRFGILAHGRRHEANEEVFHGFDALRAHGFAETQLGV